jgi:O-antigen ligase
MTGSARAAPPAVGRLSAIHRRTLRGLVGDWPRTTRPLPWALAGFMAMLWLLPFDSIDLPIGLPLEAKLDRPVLLLIVALWVLSLTILDGAQRVRFTPIHYAFVGFVLIAILSLVYNAETTVRLGEMELGVRKLALLISYLTLFVVVASGVRPGEVRAFMTFMCGLAVVTALAVIWEYRYEYNVFFTWTHSFLPVTIPPELGNSDSIGRRSIIGPTIHPLAPAMMMACAMPFALISMYQSREMRRKILWGAAAGIMFAAALATQRKTSIVAPFAVLAVLTAYRPRILRQLVPGLIGLFIIAHIFTPGALGGVGNQLLPQNMFGVASTVDRQSDYSAIEPDVINRPLLGRGYETYDQKKYRILDNQFLTTIIGTGIIGILSYISIFLAIFLIAHRVARNGKEDRVGPALAIVAATAAMLVGSGLLDILALPQLPYLVCFFAGFAAVLSRELGAETVPRPARSSRRAPVGPGGPIAATR